MGYFASLMRQTGLPSNSARRGSYAIEVDAQVMAAAPPSTGEGVQMGMEAASLSRPTAPPARRLMPLQAHEEDLRDEGSHPAASPAIVPSRRTQDPALTENLQPRPSTHEPNFAADPDRYYAKPTNVRRPAAKGITIAHVRDWVAQDWEPESESSIPPPAALPQQEIVPTLAMPAQAPQPAVRPLEADGYTLEIGSIRIEPEEPRFQQPAPVPPARRDQRPAESWTLPSRYYLR